MNKFRIVRRMALLAAGVAWLIPGGFAAAELTREQLNKWPAIPRISAHASPAAAYAIAAAAFVAVTVLAFRSAHRGTRGGGRRK